MNQIIDLKEEKNLLQLKFESFHRKNPHILSEIISLSRDMKRSGVTKGSINQIFEVLRYNYSMNDTDSRFKLANSHRAFYARLVTKLCPELYTDGKPFFSLNKQSKPYIIDWEALNLKNVGDLVKEGEENQILPSGNINTYDSPRPTVVSRASIEEKNEDLLKRAVDNFTQAQRAWLKNLENLSDYESEWSDTIKKYQEGKEKLEEDLQAAQKHLDKEREKYRNAMKKTKEYFFKHRINEIKKENLLEIISRKEYVPEAQGSE